MKLGASLNRVAGKAAMKFADVDDVHIAGELLDAGPVGSPVLSEIGVQGASSVSNAGNRIWLNDVFFSIGGATAGTETAVLEIDGDNVNEFCSS